LDNRFRNFDADIGIRMPLRHKNTTVSIFAGKTALAMASKYVISIPILYHGNLVSKSVLKVTNIMSVSPGIWRF
jgi:hypothetical protein